MAFGREHERAAAGGDLDTSSSWIAVEKPRARWIRKLTALRASSLGAIALMTLALSVPAQQFDQAQALAISRAAVGNLVGPHQFRERDGSEVSLTSLRGRPLVLSLVFTSCYGSCSILTRRLAQGVEVARDALGSGAFHVVSIGFDTANDSPARMASFAQQHGVDDENWRFLSADETTIAKLIDEIGFGFVASPRGFDHVAQTTIIDAQGRVYRQVYGDSFPTPALVEPLKELVLGTAAKATTLDGWIAGVRLLCTIYDSSTDRYHFDYSIFVGGFVGLFCLGAVALFIVRSWRTRNSAHELIR